MTSQNASALILWVHWSRLIWKSFHAHLQCSSTNLTWAGFCSQYCLSLILLYFVLQDRKMRSGKLSYILPGAKMFPNRIHCYVLEHQNPTTNDFYHTHVVVPEQRDMCNSLKGSCNSPNCFKLHLESFQIASILQLATYKTPAGTYNSCFVRKKTPGHYKFKKTEQAICVFQKYLQTCSCLYNDFVAQVITQSDSDGDFMQ